jgi:hypothetical protein
MIWYIINVVCLTIMVLVLWFLMRVYSESDKSASCYVCGKDCMFHFKWQFRKHTFVDYAIDVNGKRIRQ